MNYKADYPMLSIIKTGEAVNGLEIFGTYKQARDALVVWHRKLITEQKAILQSALKVRERDLPVKLTEDATEAVVRAINALKDRPDPWSGRALE